MTAPEVEQTTRIEREQFIQDEFRCLADCDLCGKCQILHNRYAEEVYSDYLEGKRSFLEISLELRRPKKARAKKSWEKRIQVTKVSINFAHR